MSLGPVAVSGLSKEMKKTNSEAAKEHLLKMSYRGKSLVHARVSCTEDEVFTAVEKDKGAGLDT